MRRYGTTVCGRKAVVEICESWISLAFVGWTSLKLRHDGLEREFRSFKQLEGRVCASCAPENREKSIEGKAEQTLQGLISTAQCTDPARPEECQRRAG